MGKRNYSQLTRDQRIELSALHKAGHSKQYISNALCVNRSTVYRELARNSTQRGSYDAYQANQKAEIRKERFAKNRKLDQIKIKIITEKLVKQQWSPEQIKGYCDRKNIPMVSHERIYQFIYQDKSSGGKLYEHLRGSNKKYKKRYGKHKNRKVIIKNKISIDQRPSLVNNKERVGDWEIDTIVGKNNRGAILTIVERKSSFILIKKLKGKNADDLARETIRLLAPYKDLVHSITSDNGTEFAKHELIAKKLEADFYFAHPYSSWERGLNEYSNKLIRQYIPKKSDFDYIENNHILRITDLLNNRPRKLLDFRKPVEVFY